MMKDVLVRLTSLMHENEDVLNPQSMDEWKNIQIDAMHAMDTAFVKNAHLHADKHRYRQVWIGACILFAVNQCREECMEE
jgi:hypothetical protein